MAIIGLLLLLLALAVVIGIVVDNNVQVIFSLFGTTVDELTVAGLFVGGVLTAIVGVLGLWMMKVGAARSRRRRIEAARGAGTRARIDRAAGPGARATGAGQGPARGPAATRAWACRRLGATYGTRPAHDQRPECCAAAAGDSRAPARRRPAHAADAVATGRNRQPRPTSPGRPPDDRPRTGRARRHRSRRHTAGSYPHDVDEEGDQKPELNDPAGDPQLLAPGPVPGTSRRLTTARTTKRSGIRPMRSMPRCVARPASTTLCPPGAHVRVTCVVASHC